MSEKQKLLDFITNLQDDLSSKEILSQILVYFKIQEALTSIDEGKTTSNEEMKELILKCWFGQNQLKKM